MTAESTTLAPFGGRITAQLRRTGLKSVFFKIAKPLFLLLLLPGLLLSAAKARPVPGATITLNGGQLTNVFSSDDFTVTFTTAQTGLTASNFTVTGTVTGAFVSNVTGSGTSWTVTVTIPGSFQSQGTFTLNLANSTNLSPGLSGLPIAAPAVGVIAYPVDGTLSLSSTNANSGYAKTGDKINFTLQSAHYELEFWSVNVAGQNASGGPNFSQVATGQVTLGSGTAQGPLAWGWHYTNTFNENNSGSGTSGIIFDSVNPTISVGAPSAGSTSTGPVTYNVTYADANFNTSSLSTSNITLNTTGTATGTVTLVENSATNYTVTISNITGAGTLGISIAAGTASDMAGNLAPASSASTTFNVVQPLPTTTSISSNNNPSFSTSPNNSVTFTATVTSFGSPVTSGTVSFTSNGAAIVNGTNVALNGSGQASVTTTFSTGGAYTILATYNANSNFSTSSGSLNQQVNLHPTTINSISANNAHSNAGTIQFTVTFGASVSGLSTANFSLAATGGISGAAVASVSPSSGATYTVTVNTGTGEGTIGLNFSDASGISPAISTSLPFTGRISIVDKTAPTVQSITAAYPSNATPVNNQPVVYMVTFSEDVTGLDVNAFSIIKNNITLDNVTVNPVSASVYLVDVAEEVVAGPPNGTLQLNLTDGSRITDLAGNPLSNTLNGDTYIIDIKPPTVNSITAAAPGNGNPTNATSVTYTVSFSEAMINVSAQNFGVTAGGGVSTGGISVSQIDAADYSVTVNGISGSGTLRLDVLPEQGASDVAGNLIYTGFTTGDVYTIDQTPPLANVNYSSNNSTNSNYAKVGDKITVDAQFNEAVQTPVITINGKPVTALNTTGNTWDASYTLTSADTEGLIGFDIKATDIAGNTGDQNTAVNGKTVTFDKTPPVVVIGNPSTTAAQGGPVTYSINFSDANLALATLRTPDITLNTTGNATAAINVDNNGISATITLSNITGDGTLGISIGQGTAVDLANNFANSAGPSTTFIVDNTPPTASISAPSAAAIGAGGPGTISYTVTYADANFNTSNLTGAGITLNATGTATGTVGITGSGTSYTITISGITGLGTLGISVGAGYASDQAGNTDAGAGPSATFNVTTASTDATLSALSLSSGTLAPAFNPGTVSYTASVANGITSITVTPTATAGTSAITVNGATVASGAASASLPLNVGANAITTVVTAPDGGTTKTYTTTVTRAASATATLSFLRLTGIAISPAFTPAVTGYTASVANSVTSVTVLPTVPANGSTITVNGVTVASGAASGGIPLNAGPNTISTVVTAQNGITTKTYTITVTRTGASIATLAGLSISSGTLSPAFAVTKTSYKATVTNATTSITVTPTTTDTSATVTVNGAAVTSGSASAALPLTPGSNTITTIVTAQDGVTMDTYTITLTRTPSTNANLNNLKLAGTTLSPAFAFATTSYTASVAASVSSTTVTPTVSVSGSTVTVNGVSVISGTPSGSIPLATGQNTITIVVTAQDGITTKTYTVVVTRPSTNANLAALAISSGTLAPAFATATTSYTASVANSVSAVTLTPTTADATAAVTVNGTAVASGSASGSLPLNVGDNTITTVVTAQDGVTTKTYSVVVTRAPSANANILKVKISSGTLSPTFVQATTSYTDSVVNSVSSITVTPTASDVNATITVNGTAVTSGTASGAIPLNVGPNTITIICLAQNGTTTKTYTVTVTRAPSSIATLSALGLSPGALAPAFAVNRTSYTASAANSVSSVTITPVTTEPNATVKVNGAAVASGAASGGIPLNVGPNTIATVVTAQDGSTTQTYTVTVTRAASTNANILKLKLSSGTLSPAFGQATTSYTASVANSVSSITATPTTSDANATVTVNGANVVSGTASAAIPLNVGSNTVTVVCTAQDGVTKKTYTVTVTRASGDLNSIYQPISVSQPGNDLHLADNITVHQGISPNGDGMNDVLVIDGITAYPDNKLSIMSRNGELVFEASGYDNSSRVFDGHSSKNGKMQSPGTYFYSLEYKVGEVTKHKTGFIILKY